MFVVEVGSVLTTIVCCCAISSRRDAEPRRSGSRLAVVGLALVHGHVRELRGGGGRGPRQGAGGLAAPHAQRDHRATGCANGASRKSSTPPRCGAAIVVVVEAGEIIPGDGEVIEGRRVRRRIGDHGRVRAGDPRERRRSLGGDGRHQGALRPDRRPHHVEPGRDLPRSHDRARRGGRAPEDPERDRAAHPAGRA